MRKTIIAYFFFLFSLSYAQPVTFQWGKCIGGSGNDVGNSVFAIDSNIIVVCGSTESGDGDINNHDNWFDFWIIKLNTSGDILWNNCYGGSDDEQAVSIVKTFDNGFALTGYTKSNDHDVSGRHGTSSFHDIWVMKIDSTGNLLWQKCLGGSYSENSTAIIETIDKGFIVTGETESSDGDIQNSHGDVDSWVVKLDSLGNILWAKTIGGSGPETITSCKETSDGEIIVAGYENSLNMDFQNCSGGITSDAWCAKLDSTGNLLWLNCYGGSSSDGFYKILIDQFNNIYGIGGSSSNDGDVSGGYGVTDYWLTKIDFNGNLIWSKCYGGSNYDFSNDATFSIDNGIILTGFTNSIDGMLNGSTHGNGDYWTLKVDTSGNYLWDICLGGTSEDWATSVYQLANNQIITVGYTLSNDIDVSGNHGLKDLLITSLYDNLAGIDNIDKNSITNFTCHSEGNFLDISFNSQVNTKANIIITDILGKQLNSEDVLIKIGSNKFLINCNLNNNICIVSLFTNDFILSKKLLLQ